mmetsp:Transcript_30686/g.70704  ORF Transcript_30686/g.70704 Transcript_30686/m.70704 type:complete len:144 (-) Transcript_30686:47-478(-)
MERLKESRKVAGSTDRETAVVSSGNKAFDETLKANFSKLVEDGRKRLPETSRTSKIMQEKFDTLQKNNCEKIDNSTEDLVVEAVKNPKGTELVDEKSNEPPVGSVRKVAVGHGWGCPRCTFWNQTGIHGCAMCGHEKRNLESY